MNEYIKREDAIARSFRFYWRSGTLSNPVVSVKNLKDIPAADVAPVRHGRWEGRPSGVMVACSLCSQSYPSWRIFPANYCPNCGAKMDGGEAQ